MSGARANLRLAEETDREFVLMDFAYGTGGTFFHSNDLEGGLKQAGSVPDVSYVLGFSPQNQKLDGRYHTLKVALAVQHKYTIQARRGYFAPNKAEDPKEIARLEIQEAAFTTKGHSVVPFTLKLRVQDSGAYRLVLLGVDSANYQAPQKKSSSPSQTVE